MPLFPHLEGAVPSESPKASSAPAKSSSCRAAYTAPVGGRSGVCVDDASAGTGLGRAQVVVSVGVVLGVIAVLVVAVRVVLYRSGATLRVVARCLRVGAQGCERADARRHAERLKM